MDNVDVGNKVLKARRAKGLTQEELSEMSSISVRTIQRIESGLVTPRAYTIKTISKHLGVDLLPDLEELITDNNLGQNLKQKWTNGINDLFNLKTHTMKKISILSVIFSLIALGLYALTNEWTPLENDSIILKHVDDVSSAELPCGFYAQIIDGDTTYCGLITENYVDLHELAPTVNYTSEFGYKFLLGKFSIRKKQASSYGGSTNNQPLLDTLGFVFSVPKYKFKKISVTPVGANSNPLIGFYFNRRFSSPIGVGTFDAQYFTDLFNLKEVISKFKNVPNLLVALDNQMVGKGDYEKLMDYKVVEFSKVRSVIVRKDGDNCRIDITTSAAKDQM